MMPYKTMLSMSTSTTIPPAMNGIAIARPAVAFLVERIVIAPGSFPLSIARRAWTWPLVQIGGLLRLTHRVLARALGVDLWSNHWRDEAVSEDFARAHPDEVFYREDGDDGTDRPYISVQDPPSRRERAIAPIARIAQHLSEVRVRWQRSQLATVKICDVQIAGRSQFVAGAEPLPGDMFGADVIDGALNLPTCYVGNDIRIEVANAGRRPCRLIMAVIGTVH